MEGRIYKERQQERVTCTEFGKELAKGSMVEYRQNQHGVAKGGSGQEGNEKGGSNDPKKFSVVFPAKARPSTFLVEGRSGWAATQTSVRAHFWKQHVQDTVVKLEEGNLPHPPCPMCNMLVPWRYLNRMHRLTAQCKKGVEWNLELYVCPSYKNG